MSDDNRPGASRAQLEAWVLSTLPRASAYAASLLRDRSLADDVVHDCYLRLLQKAEVYDLLRDGTKLLFKAITNTCIDRNYRDRSLLSLDGSDSSTAPVETGAGPVQSVMQKELEGVVEEGLAGLPVAQRAALELKALGHSTQEIADALGTSPSNAGVLVHRARRALAEVVARYRGPSDDERT